MKVSSSAAAASRSRAAVSCCVMTPTILMPPLGLRYHRGWRGGALDSQAGRGSWPLRVRALFGLIPAPTESVQQSHSVEVRHEHDRLFAAQQRQALQLIPEGSP